jgi:NADPH:quinone reductase-like Zn-dependent oxidoreductase
MKAVVLRGFGSADQFTLTEVDKPEMLDDQVLVRIKATSFNPIDYQMRQGAAERKLLKSPILGRELAGVIEATGKGVTQYGAGDEVAAYVGGLASNGTYAEYISIPQSLIARKPASVSFAQAAALPMAGLTALQCVERLNLPEDSLVLVTGGAGGVGTMLIKLLLSRGMGRLFTTAGSGASKSHLVDLGLDEIRILDYREPAILQYLTEATAGRKFDCCIDLVGGTMSELCSQVIRVNGVFADVTFLTTGKAREQLFDKATTIVNIANYAYSLTGDPADTAYYGRKLHELFAWIGQQTIPAPPVAVVGALSAETVKAAHHMLENNMTAGKKLVMIVD